MVNSGVISKGALATGVLGVGLVSGLAAASLGMTGVAVASCVNFSGIAIGGGGAGGHCQAAFGNIAIVIALLIFATIVGYLGEARTITE